MATRKSKKIPDLAEDRPIERSIDDRLDRLPFVESLARALVREEKDSRGDVVARRSTGIVVGLTGRWGSGKSSILNLLAEHLGSLDHVAVATLNPWLFKGRDELLTAFFNELRDALGRSPQEHVRDLAKFVEQYRSAIKFGAKFFGMAADTAGTGGIGCTAAKGVADTANAIANPKPLSPQEERRALESRLQRAKVAVVVLVDELDRVDDDDVRVVAQLVKAIGDIKGVSYLVAYDPNRVADALGRGSDDERRRTGESYLEKIIQHPIPLRPLFSNDVLALFDALLQAHGLKLPSDLSDEEREVIECIRESVTTPRELKRLVGSYAVIDLMIRGEISPADLMGYCWLLAKAPAIREAIASNPDAVVDDPTYHEISRRVLDKMGKSVPDLSVILDVPVGEHEEILKLLFPRFGKTRKVDTGNRLSRRRNLIRVVYLGDPPGIARRDQVVALWNENDPNVLALTLNRLLVTGKLRPIIDRLDDLLPKLPEAGDVRFFRALAKALFRETDWLLAPEENRSIAEDAGTHLMRLGLRDKRQVKRVKTIVEALAKVNDLIFVPFILRKHLFKWGLTIHNRDPLHGEFVFDKTETEDLLARTVPIFRTALLDGTLLRRIPNSEALFALSNAAKWDDDVRASLTKQLQYPEARASFAALMIPPGYSIEKKFLDQIIDSDAVLAAMCAANEGRQSGTWSENCLRRFRYALRGRDTAFLNDHDEDEDDDDAVKVS
jgi:hypothetical protein